MCITFFLYIYQPSLRDYNVKVPNFKFCLERENIDYEQSPIFPQGE